MWRGVWCRTGLGAASACPRSLWAVVQVDNRVCVGYSMGSFLGTAASTFRHTADTRGAAGATPREKLALCALICI